MPVPTKHTFTIADKVNSDTGKPFGQDYAGSFTVRRPSIGDKAAIATMRSSLMNRHGAGGDRAGDFWDVYFQLLAFLAVCGDGVADWWNPEEMYGDQDEAAVLAVWGGVSQWLGTFRLGSTAGDGGEGGPQPPVLVPPAV